VSDPCWTGDFTNPNSGTLCSTDPSDQNKFLFWDEVHPTAAGHLLAAEFALDALTAVPEVSTWAMMLVGFAGLGLHAIRHSRKRAVMVYARVFSRASDRSCCLRSASLSAAPPLLL
jgi:phospholipase/lecithinase/hemolysin